MKQLLWVVLLCPLLVQSQSKKKKRQAEEKTNTALVLNLKKHVQYLADDQLEGRRSGTRGEEMALQYLIAQYKEMGIEPKGQQGYVQEFTINEGKQYSATTYLKIGGKTLEPGKEYMPLAFSPEKTLKGTPAFALNEYQQPWFKDLKDLLEENKTNPHFDVEAAIKKETEAAAAKGATALLLYNTSSVTDNVQFNKNDTSASVSIPVVYITREGQQKYFSDPSATLPLELSTGFYWKKRQARNLVAFINNQSPNTVVLGAHYDHLGFGEDKNALDTSTAVHNGADDNASGTAALLELARMLKQQAPKGNNYLLIHFSGEEQGLLGSKYWMEHPTTQISPNYMINMDMVGRYDTARKLTVGGYGTSPVWGEIWKQAAPKLAVHFDSTGSGPSDHASFYRNNVPVLFLFTGSHGDYHKATDDWDKINYDAQRDIVKLVYQVIGIADTKGKLAFTKTTQPQMGRSTGFTVSMGVLPDYSFTGTGMRIEGVSAGKLAEKSGLQAGDVLLQLGDYKFVDVMSYMQSLSKFKKGDQTLLRYKRGNEWKELAIVF